MERIHRYATSAVAGALFIGAMASAPVHAEGISPRAATETVRTILAKEVKGHIAGPIAAVLMDTERGRYSSAEKELIQIKRASDINGDQGLQSAAGRGYTYMQHVISTDTLVHDKEYAQQLNTKPQPKYYFSEVKVLFMGTAGVFSLGLVALIVGNSIVEKKKNGKMKKTAGRHA